MPSVLKDCLQKNSIACANERIPRGHVKVPSWELFILHIAVRFGTAIVFKNTLYHILHAGRKQPFATLVHAESF